MARPTPRRLTMADLAILTAGAATSMGILRVSRETLVSSRFVVPAWTELPGYVAGLALLSLSLGPAAAVVVARAIPPRPPWRVAFRQPGFSACLAILAHMGTIILTYSWHAFLGPILHLATFRANFNNYLYGNHDAGGWVAVAWTTLALTRAWRPEPSWIDRSGRVLGVVAILYWFWSSLIW